MHYRFLPMDQSQVAERIAGQPPALGLTAILKRWLARFVEARNRRAAIQVLRYLDERLPHATEPDRAYMVALADDLRRSLR